MLIISSHDDDALSATYDLNIMILQQEVCQKAPFSSLKVSRNILCLTTWNPEQQISRKRYDD